MINSKIIFNLFSDSFCFLPEAEQFLLNNSSDLKITLSNLAARFPTLKLFGLSFNASANIASLTISAVFWLGFEKTALFCTMRFVVEISCAGDGGQGLALGIALTSSLG